MSKPNDDFLTRKILEARSRSEAALLRSRLLIEESLELEKKVANLVQGLRSSVLFIALRQSVNNERMDKKHAA
jgi:hypothetical protein